MRSDRINARDVVQKIEKLTRQRMSEGGVVELSNLRELKQQPGKGICVLGGGELAQSLFQEGVIDEVGLNVHPVLLGSGVPLFRDPGRRVSLVLIESRVIHGGCVLSRYRVAAVSKPVAQPKRKPRRSAKPRRGSGRK